FSEVLRHFGVIRRAFKDIQTHLSTVNPDLLVLVDYPGFNLRLAQFAKQKLGLRILYYISPQIWAWKAGRINIIRHCVDKMAVILPFEKKIYEQAGVPVAFVGHPLLHQTKQTLSMADSREKLGLPKSKRVIALLPGSRRHEIERHMPIMLKSAEILCQEFDDLHFVIPVANTINPQLINAYFKNANITYTLTESQAVPAAASSDCVVVASGTASLECALLEKPMCIIYKASLISFITISRFIKIKYVGLCNILQNQMIVPELLQYDCNPVELTRAIKDLLTDQEVITRMQTRLKTLKSSLSSHHADTSICTLIENELRIGSEKPS
ncbi:MAG: lipid-A-disaccharide synthase, partial [Legionellales bacterium]|nr:lipid-A-disaccharide synthase [Legionellales bacterium]